MSAGDPKGPIPDGRRDPYPYGVSAIPAVSESQLQQYYRTEANQLAKVSALLGIVPAVSMLVGIPLGFIALNQLQRRGQRGMGYAMTGIFAGLMWVLLFAGLRGQAP